MPNQELIDALSLQPSRAELVRQVAELEGIAHRRSMLMAAAGHDLSQPLQTIMCAIEHVSSDKSDADAIFWRGVAKQQVTRLAHGLTELMLASRDDSPCFSGIARAFDVASLFDSLEAEWAAAAFHKGLYLRFVRSSALIMGDPTILRTILTNLIGNAIKYTMQGGVVVGCRRSGDQVAIEVADTGCGFDGELHQRMFDAFSQGQSNREGFGIGLWLVHRLALLCAYDLNFWSRPGSGSRFRVSVPIAPRIATN